VGFGTHYIGTVVLFRLRHMVHISVEVSVWLPSTLLRLVGGFSVGVGEHDLLLLPLG
jgi:hypothetical protein